MRSEKDMATPARISRGSLMPGGLDDEPTGGDNPPTHGGYDAPSAHAHNSIRRADRVRNTMEPARRNPAAGTLTRGHGVSHYSDVFAPSHPRGRTGNE